MGNNKSSPRRTARRDGSRRDRVEHEYGAPGEIVEQSGLVPCPRGHVQGETVQRRIRAVLANPAYDHLSGPQMAAMAGVHRTTWRRHVTPQLRAEMLAQRPAKQDAGRRERVVGSLMALAEAGNVNAAKLLLDEFRRESREAPAAGAVKPGLEELPSLPEIQAEVANLVKILAIPNPVRPVAGQEKDPHGTDFGQTEPALGTPRPVAPDQPAAPETGFEPGPA